MFCFRNSSYKHVNVGINGFGRLARLLIRCCFENENYHIRVTAINDSIAHIVYMSYLLRYDSSHGKFNSTVEIEGDMLIINGRRIKIYHEKYSERIPWDEANVHFVIETTGDIKNLEQAKKHMKSKVERVILTTECIDIPIFTMGFNDKLFDRGIKIVTTSSSSLYCLLPIMKILDDNYEIVTAMITYMNAITPSLKSLNGLCMENRVHHSRRSLENISAKSNNEWMELTKLLPHLKNKICGVEFQIPVHGVSLIDITVSVRRKTSLQAIIKTVQAISQSQRYHIIKVIDKPVISSDLIGDSYSCIIDANASLSLNHNNFKIICWYDSDYSHAKRIIDTINYFNKDTMLDNSIDATNCNGDYCWKNIDVKNNKLCNRNIYNTLTLQVSLDTKNLSNYKLLEPNERNDLISKMKIHKYYESLITKKPSNICIIENNEKKLIELLFKDQINMSNSEISLDEQSSSLSNDIDFKMHLYDKLASKSDIDSTDSFDLNAKKSLIVRFSDITMSDEIKKLDKLCKYLEISNNMSDNILPKKSTTNIKLI